MRSGEGKIERSGFFAKVRGVRHGDGSDQSRVSFGLSENGRGSVAKDRVGDHCAVGGAEANAGAAGGGGLGGGGVGVEDEAGERATARSARRRARGAKETE